MKNKKYINAIKDIQESESSMPANLEKELNKIIHESTHKLESTHKKDKKNFLSKKSILLWTGSIAASIVLILSITLSHNTPKDTFSDPLLAYNETSKALKLLSKKMNEGVNTGIKNYKEAEKKSKNLYLELTKKNQFL